MSWFIDCFSTLPDPRKGNAKRHDLLEVLTIALTASICGADSCVEFADFAVEKADLFAEFLELENGLPSHDTFSRIFNLIDPDAFQKSFAAFVSHLGEAGAGVLAIDGKTLRRSFSDAAQRSPLAVVTAFAGEQRLVLAQKSYRQQEGGSEIIAAREVLNSLDLNGVLVTADSLHCQQATAELICNKGGSYLFQLCKNWPVLHKDVEEYFLDPVVLAAEPHQTVDNDHGRLEIRRYRVCHDIDWLRSDRRHTGETKPLFGQTTIAMVETETTREGETTIERRYYVSSARLGAERFGELCRGHWLIENRQHWMLDMNFDEDRARNRVKNGPENLAIIRRLALNILQNSRRDISVRRKRKRSGWSNDFARTIIGQMRPA